MSIILTETIAQRLFRSAVLALTKNPTKEQMNNGCTDFPDGPWLSEESMSELRACKSEKEFRSKMIDFIEKKVLFDE
jgi:hypothetical protein